MEWLCSWPPGGLTEPIPLWVTGCIALAAYPLIGAAEVHEVALQYLDPVNWLFLGGMLSAASMQQWGLHRRIALGIRIYWNPG